MFVVAVHVSVYWNIFISCKTKTTIPRTDIIEIIYLKSVSYMLELNLDRYASDADGGVRKYSLVKYPFAADVWAAVNLSCKHHRFSPYLLSGSCLLWYRHRHKGGV